MNQLEGPKEEGLEFVLVIAFQSLAVSDVTSGIFVTLFNRQPEFRKHTIERIMRLYHNHDFRNWLATF
jgi:hypothetical protein